MPISQKQKPISTDRQSVEQYESRFIVADKFIALQDIEFSGMVPIGIVPNGTVPNGTVPKGTVPKGTVPKGVLERTTPKSVIPQRIVISHSGFILPVVLMLMVMVSIMTLSALSRASLLQKRLAYSQQMSELDGVALRYLKRCEDDIYQHVLSTPTQFNSLQRNYIQSSLDQNPRAWRHDNFIRDYLTLEFNLANQGLVQCAGFIMPIQQGQGAAFANHHILAIYLEATSSNLRRRYRSDVFI